MTYLINIIQIILLYFRIISEIKKQRTYVNKEFTHHFDAIKKATRKRMITYSVYIPVFIGYSYSTLRKQKLSLKERKALTALGALTALVDDYFDDTDFQIQDIIDLSNNKKIAQTSQEIILTNLYNIVYENIIHKDDFKQLIQKVIESQIESKEQERSNITINELETITSNKGGFTMQLYRTAFHNAYKAAEMELYYLVGSIGQLENDIFDIHKDKQDGIHTLATEIENLHDLLSIFNDKQNALYQKLIETDFPEKNKRLFWLILNLIIKRGNVALSNYIRNTSNLQASNLNLRELYICDMEKPINIVKLIHYAASWRKK